LLGGGVQKTEESHQCSDLQGQEKGENEGFGGAQPAARGGVQAAKSRKRKAEKIS
jgi:hypothetical protein